MRFVSGQVVINITSADGADLLIRMQKERIFATNIIYRDGLNLQITINRCDYSRLKKLAENAGGTIRVKHSRGTNRIYRSLKKRPIAFITILFLFVLSVFIPRRVLFISVEGNVSIPEKRILEAAEECGLHFGAERRLVRSESIKNVLLQKVPQLQWAGVNTRGCTATISVREKTRQNSEEDTENQICSIIAARDGIVRNCTVYQGNPLCTVGQAVKAGQTLVSAYTDCGSMIKAARADAEITALTFRDLEIVSPKGNITRGDVSSQKVYYKLRIGKKVINLSKDSGNLHISCGKIYSEKSVRLYGGFMLPVSLIQETIIYYDNAERVPVDAEEPLWLEAYSQCYLKKTMIAGDIVSAQTERVENEALWVLRGQFACMEMIGQIKYEQTLLKD